MGASQHVVKSMKEFMFSQSVLRDVDLTLVFFHATEFRLKFQGFSFHGSGNPQGAPYWLGYCGWYPATRAGRSRWIAWNWRFTSDSLMYHIVTSPKIGEYMLSYVVFAVYFLLRLMR